MYFNNEVITKTSTFIYLKCRKLYSHKLHFKQCIFPCIQSYTFHFSNSKSSNDTEVFFLCINRNEYLRLKIFKFQLRVDIIRLEFITNWPIKWADSRVYDFDFFTVKTQDEVSKPTLYKLASCIDGSEADDVFWTCIWRSDKPYTCFLFPWYFLDLLLIALPIFEWLRKQAQWWQVSRTICSPKKTITYMYNLKQLS